MGLSRSSKSTAPTGGPGSTSLGSRCGRNCPRLTRISEPPPSTAESSAAPPDNSTARLADLPREQGSSDLPGASLGLRHVRADRLLDVREGVWLPDDAKVATPRA